MTELEVTVERKAARGIRLDLVGEDIMPRRYADRTITPAKLTAIWFVMAIEITLFITCAQLYPALSVWQIVWACVLGHTALCVIMWFTQDFGIKYGLPFAVSLRASFGYVGTFIPTYLRAIPAMFWFGFQTWVGAEAINSITVHVWGFDNLTLWIVILGAIQIAHTTLGIKAVTRLSVLATPLLLVVGIYLLFLIFRSQESGLLEIMRMGGDPSARYNISLATMCFIGGWATLALSIMDITKDCIVEQKYINNFWASTKGFMVAQWAGLVPAAVFYGFIGVMGMIATGEYNPVMTIVKVIGPENEFLMLVSLVFVLVATWSTNDTANLFPGAYAIATTFPSKINFAKGVIIAGLIGLAMRPWAVADILVEVQVIFGAILAPVTGIVICDYFILRKRRLNLNEMYRIDGQYKYWKNVNPAALIALAAGVIVSLPFWDYVFVVGMLGAGVAYYFLMKYWIVRIYPQPEIDG